MYRILIIEDDAALNNGIALALNSGDIIFKSVFSLNEAKHILESEIFDLILLDINLPDGSGITFLKELRSKSDTPVVILTANDMETDIVSGFELGADDYITKPFSLAVLRARVGARLRKSGRHSNLYKSGEYSFDFDKLEFAVKGKAVDLSKTEQKLLRILIENKGAAVSRDMLLDRVWSDVYEYVDENALSVAVKRLRDKLGDSGAIKTVYGIGYMWTVK